MGAATDTEPRFERPPLLRNDNLAQWFLT